MAGMLTQEQVKEIKELRAKIRALGLEDWMCEGSDVYGPGFILFNNETDQSIYCSPFGKIYSSSVDPISDELRKLIEYEARIYRISYVD